MTIMFGISAAVAVVRNLDDAGFLLALTPKAGSHPNPSHVQTSQALIQIQSQIQNQALIQIQIQSKSKSKSRLSSKSQSCSDKPPVQSQAWIQIGIKIKLDKKKLSSVSSYGFQWSFAIHCNDNALPITSYYVAIQGLWDFNQNKTDFSPMQGREGVVVFEAVLKLGIENLPRPAHYTFPLLRVLTLQIQIQIQIQMQIQIEIQIAKHQYQCK